MTARDIHQTPAGNGPLSTDAALSHNSGSRDRRTLFIVTGGWRHCGEVTRVSLAVVHTH